MIDPKDIRLDQTYMHDCDESEDWCWEDEED